MKRRGFLKKLGLGAAALTIASHSLSGLSKLVLPELKKDVINNGKYWMDYEEHQKMLEWQREMEINFWYGKQYS